jgi:predicted RNA-binding protein with PIN domain
VRWLVDGMNVIGSRPTGWWRDRPAAMRKLTAELEGFAGRSGDQLTVIFDGQPFELDGHGVEVRFASRRGRNAADDDIARLAAEDEEPGTLTVVSSDAELVRRVQAVGAQTLGAGAFRRRLEGAEEQQGGGSFEDEGQDDSGSSEGGSAQGESEL